MQPVTNIPVITIDGPSGVGKGTLARHLAHKLGWHILDSGAIYRLLALHAQKQQLKSSDTAALAASAAHLDIDCRIQDKQIIYLLHQEDVSADIRTEACAGFASEIARIAELRQLLLAKQRAFKRPPGLVADGRDMGTVVFPEAVYKIFLTASPAERARRRYRELQQKGRTVALELLQQQLTERDQRDRLRSVAPLMPAKDAIVIDTTDLTADAVIDQVSALLEFV